jgi:hypothetical protein
MKKIEAIVQEDRKVTSPEEYAKKAQLASAAESVGFLHTLEKTGATVRLRRVDMQTLALVGSLPMSLVSSALAKDEDNQDKTKKKKKDKAPTPEEVEAGNNNLIFMRQMVVENCLEPSIQYIEGQGVYFVNAASLPIAKVHPDDFMEMFEVICGEAGADGLHSFRNRKTSRALAAKSRRKARRPKAVKSTKRQPASA